MLNYNIFPLVEEDFQKIINEERQQYNYIYEHIFEYCKKYTNDKIIILSEGIAIKLLIDGDIHEKYTIYSPLGLSHAFELANEIDTIIPDNWIVFMNSKIPREKFEIFVNNRVVAEINMLRMENPVESLKPILVNNCYVMPPEFHLLNYYKKLYSPAYHDEWATIMSEERRLFHRMKQDIDKDSGGVFNKDQKKIEIKLINEFVKNNPNICLVGSYALKLIILNVSDDNIVKIISQNNFNDDIEKIKKIIPDVQYKIDNIDIIGDHKLKRVVIKSENKEVMYIYNSGNYELIPFNKNECGDNFIQVGSPFVIMRFLLVDIWIMKKMLISKKINERFASAKINSFLANFVKLRDSMSSPEDSGIRTSLFSTNKAGSIFQRENYIGTYIDEIKEQKRYQLKKKIFIKNYYPKNHLYKYGVYRTMDK